ncbi:uncharacterized protein F5147DRAFT_121994 [Suillus discolor]|uniref:Uncharacterized protein n=1 Tax=Suillus discolor TaxID=1912936 RepID=A0A9P7FIR1_9AGAM|nr:uncharacterized protein F5147DRAFT_121994 [Suillus discolor]KAG2119790.1 hypothetical protein F5147DRAFT_121994 [Suillus discolor]
MEQRDISGVHAHEYAPGAPHLLVCRNPLFGEVISCAMLILHTMGMEGGLDQCPGIHHQPCFQYLLQNRVTWKTLIMITHSIDYIRMIVCMNRPCNAVVVFDWESCAQKNGAVKLWQMCMKSGASALHCAASSMRGLLQYHTWSTEMRHMFSRSYVSKLLPAYYGVRILPSLAEVVVGGRGVLDLHSRFTMSRTLACPIHRPESSLYLNP